MRPDPVPDVALAPEDCRRRREALGLSLEDLARRAGRELRTVERFEAAAVRPRPVTIVALRNALRRAELEQAQL
ncbi:MAG: helix-turn-helix domain-containing protein [Alphaproteobacteria bacterium]|nr:helix-turn-helix domain-containing protein [Alphaproteobacteria bacterium]MBU2094413.1 helix-turn-helix domain-containing protein [Alphaproteobacteria bacterium]MBU2307585.1 helix-turn-helix domain-containing protein [Alphaproteobacteria bacterium]